VHLLQLALAGLLGLYNLGLQLLLAQLRNQVCLLHVELDGGSGAVESAVSGF